MKRVATSMLAAVAIVSVVFTAGASGHRFAFDTTVTANYEKGNKHNDPLELDSFHGRVTSEKAGCANERRVVVKRRNSDGTVTAVGTDYTNDHGNWEVKLAEVRGTYFARAAKKVLRKGAKHRHYCAKDSSPDVRVRGK